MRWGVCDVLCSKERASEGATEEDANLRNINAATLSGGEEIHEKQGVRKQVEM
jgi:hypothetical protein